jgi:hypothetical protein
MKSLSAIAAALLCPLAAAAGPWSQQPTEVMGIRLGAPLHSAGLPPCDAVNEVRGRLSTAAMCFHPRSAPARPERTYYTVHNAPDLGAGRQQVVIDVADGHVAGVLLTGSARRFAEVAAVLEARYGKPTETVGDPARHGSGGNAGAISKRWRGDRVTIEAVSPFGQPDEYTVYWSDLATQARREAQLARDSARIAGKL